MTIILKIFILIQSLTCRKNEKESFGWDNCVSRQIVTYLNDVRKLRLLRIAVILVDRHVIPNKNGNINRSRARKNISRATFMNNFRLSLNLRLIMR